MSPRTGESTAGHVYVLISPICEYVKIGGTHHAPLKRIREINASEPYGQLGPWSLHDFRQVTNWRAVEYALHYLLRDQLVRSIPGQKELFAVSPVRASIHLEQIDGSQVVRKPKADRMFQDRAFSDFLITLIRMTGLLNWLDFQGAWTLSLFPSTAGGRYYTLNIGPHEVAFATTATGMEASVHMIHMDRLVADSSIVLAWLEHHGGYLAEDHYTTALERSVSVCFHGSFLKATEFLHMPSVRRAVVAYWTEALIRMQESGRLSTYARHHNWNAVAELQRRIKRQVR